MCGSMMPELATCQEISFLSGGDGQKPLRVNEDDPVAAGPDAAQRPQLTEDPDDDLAHRSDGIGELLLADGSGELLRLRVEGGKVEEVPRDALPDRGEGVAGELRDKGHHSLARLGEQGVRDPRIAVRLRHHARGIEPEQLGLGQCLDGKRPDGLGVQGGHAHERSAPAVADGHGPAVRGGDLDAHQPGHHHLQMRRLARHRTNRGPRRDGQPCGAHQQLAEGIRWQRPEPGCSQSFARVVVKP
jgi:hypothetical protein